MIGPLVKRFYTDLWEAGDVTKAPEILHQDLRFRGSLGETKTGIDGYLDYLHSVRTALGDYRCQILSMIVDGPKAAAQMHFSGVHRATFLGVPATGRRIGWDGAAFFALQDNRLSDVWVLGDLDGLRAQLGAST